LQLEQTTTDPVTRSGAAWLIVHKAPLGPEGRRAGRRREGQIPLLCALSPSFLVAPFQVPIESSAALFRVSPHTTAGTDCSCGNPDARGDPVGHRVRAAPEQSRRDRLFGACSCRCRAGCRPRGGRRGADDGFPRAQLRISLTIGPNDYDGKLSDAMGEINQKSQR
jgi:hypothetical protein